MDLKSTDIDRNGQSPPPPRARFFRARAGTAAMTRTDRRRFPILFAAISTLALPAAVLSAQTDGTGICDRTRPVRDAILDKLDNIDCSAVTDTHLSGIAGGLGLNAKGIETLQASDFQGLSSLEKLYLESNNLETLPADVFDGLTSLTELYLLRNDLDSLPADVFGDLTNLNWLYLNFNELQTLPGGVFDGLANLTWLGLNGNDLNALPDGVFDDLSNLRQLYLNDNELTALPDGVFGKLSSLVILNLSGNGLNSLPDDVFKGVTSLGSLGIYDNPGSPFTITAELEQRDDGVVVKVAEGAPFGMTASLSVQGGTLSTTTAEVAAGATESAVVPVTRGVSGTTVSVESVTFVVSGEVHSGVQAGTGESLTLPSAGTDGAGGNAPATGLPTISGTAQVGQTLTVDTSGIADADGLSNVTFRYQWLSSRDAEIQGATNSTYTVQESDNGKVIKVRVTFTDDAGNEEESTSEATAAVVMVGGL